MSILDKLLDMGFTLEEIPTLDVLDIIPHEPQYPEDVYLSLLGQLIPCCHLSWVESIDVPGSPFAKNIKTIFNIAERISRRLGIFHDYDRDVLNLQYAYEQNQQIIAYEMFEYGMKYQKMLDAQKKQK